MRIVCAWCEQEGKAAEMGVRAPLDDPTVTHGLCPEHYTAVVQEPPDLGLYIRRLQGYICQLEHQLQELQTEGEGPWAQALRTQLDSALRDVASMLGELSQPSHEGSVTWLRTWSTTMRIHTQLMRHILERSQLCIQRAQGRLESARVLLRARSHGRGRAAKSPQAD